AIVFFGIVAAQGNAAVDALAGQPGIAADGDTHRGSGITSAGAAEIMMVGSEGDGGAGGGGYEPRLLGDEAQDRINIRGRHLFKNSWQVAQRSFRGKMRGRTRVGSHACRSAKRIAVQNSSTKHGQFPGRVGSIVRTSELKCVQKMKKIYLEAKIHTGFWGVGN